MNMQNDIIRNIEVSRIQSAIRIKADLSRSKNKLVTRSRDTWALVIKMDGSTKYETPTGIYTIDKYHPIILPRGCSYSRSYLDPGECLIIEFQASSESSILFPFEITDGSKIIALFQKIEKRMLQKSRLRHIENLRDFYDILAILFAESEHVYVPSSKYSILDPAVEYIHEHCCEHTIRNEQLADMCGISVAYFRLLFKQHFGVSPVAYTNIKKVERAKELLQSGFVSISQVATAVGYCNPYYFSRVFKKYAGLSPSDFLRNQCRIEETEYESSNHSTEILQTDPAR